MACGSSLRPERASKAPKRFDFVDPELLLSSEDEEAGVESRNVLDCRDNDPEMDDPLQAIFDHQARFEEDLDGDSETSEEERYCFVIFFSCRRAWSAVLRTQWNFFQTRHTSGRLSLFVCC